MVTEDWTKLKVFRNLAVNKILGFVMAIDLLCCTCAGFGFLQTFGGLFLFYTFTATFNANNNFKEHVLKCWNGNGE